MVDSLGQTTRRWGGGRFLHDFDRVIVLTSPVGTTLVARLLQLLLSLCVREAQKKLHTIFLRSDVVKLSQDAFSNLTCLEATPTPGSVNGTMLKGQPSRLPGKPNFLAHTRFLIAADLLRDDTVRFEVTTQVLSDHQNTFDRILMRICRLSYGFSPVNGDVGAIDVG